MSKKAKKGLSNSSERELLGVRDGCISSASRLALVSSMLAAHSHIVPPLGMSAKDFDSEFQNLVIEELNSLSDYLFSLGSDPHNI